MGTSVAQFDQFRIIFWKSEESEKEYIDIHSDDESRNYEVCQIWKSSNTKTSYLIVLDGMNILLLQTLVKLDPIAIREYLTRRLNDRR